MRYRIFIIGLDAVFSDEENSERKKLKVLEMQTIESCTAGPVHQKAVKRLTLAIKNNYPQLKLEMPKFDEDSKWYDNYAKIASLEKTEGMINIGLDPFSVGKWYFYSFCNQHSELKKYIPETNILSLSGLESYGINELKKTPLFKPADMSNGIGVQLISKTKMKNLKVLREKLETCSITQGWTALVNDFYPFILQEFLGHNIEVTRIYAAVVFDSVQNQFKFFIDEKNSFRCIKVEKEKNDFAVESNKDSFVKVISPQEQNEIHTFLDNFFSRLKTTYNFNYRYWEILAKQYISHSQEFNYSQRLLLFSKFSLAVSQHQRFTSNKLSFFQCMLLEGFVKRLVESGNAKKYEKCVNSFVKNAFSHLLIHNYLPYVEQNQYSRLGIVFNNFARILPETDSDKETFLKIPAKSSVVLYPVRLNRFGFFLDFMTNKEKEKYCAVSKTTLDQVAIWCGLKL